MEHPRKPSLSQPVQGLPNAAAKPVCEGGIRAKRRAIRQAFAVTLLSWAILVGATSAEIIISFEDLYVSGGIPVSNPHAGLIWNNFYPNSTAWYNTPNGFTYACISGGVFAINGGGNPAAISSALFNLNGGFFSAGWRDNLILEVKGFLNGSLLYSNSYTLSATSGTPINFNYQGIDAAEFSTSGGTPHAGYSGEGMFFAVDDLDVTILHSVLIKTQPTNYSGSAGGSAGFSVSAYGAPPFTYQWLLNGTNLNNATNSVLTLTNLQAGDEGEYSVQVASLFDSVTSSNATLTVTPSPPTMITQPTIQVDPMTFGVTIFANALGTLPITYQWRLNGTNGAATTSNTLILAEPLDGVAGDYNVIASNAFGSVTSSIVTLIPELLTAVVAWGNNNNTHGQFAGQSIPPAGLSYGTAVAGGAAHSMVLNFDGTITAWGDNGFGQSIVPAGLSNVMSSTAGYFHNLALKRDGTVVAWGSNVSGETNLPAGLTNVVSVAANGCSCLPNGNKSLALKSDGRVVGWGATVVPANATNILAIAAGGNHALALKRDGSVMGWGLNANGQATAPAGLSNVVAIAAGSSHSVALRLDGTVVAWGNRFYGQTNVPVALSNVVAIAATADFNVALRNDGTVTTWGSNIAGETNVPAGLSNVIAIAAGSRHVLALRNDGKPVVVRQPLSWRFYTGSESNVILHAGVVGPPPLSLQWQRDGTNIMGATNSYLEFNNVQPADSGTYRLVVSSPHAKTAATSNAVLEVIRSGPVILSQPTNAFAFLGQIKTLAVSVTGSLPLTYQWQFNGTNILNATNAALILTNVTVANVGAYAVIVSNPVDTVSTSNAYLDLIAADFPTALNTTGLTWFTSPSSGASAWYPQTAVTHDGVAAAQSGTFVFPTATSSLSTSVAGPGTLTYWWMFGPPSTTPSNSLTFTASQGNISATVFSTGGWEQRTFYLAPGPQTLTWSYTRRSPGIQSTGWVDQVSFVPGGTPPGITAMSPDAHVRDKSAVVFAVNAYGTPPLAYQWQLNGTNLLNQTNASLTLINVQPTNSGTYTVVITNGFGAVATNAALWVAQFGFSTNPSNSFMSANGFQMQLEGILTTNSVVIWGSTNLVHWLPLFTNQASTGLIRFLDVTATNFPIRFYRAQE
jgi:hypothetical protein